MADSQTSIPKLGGWRPEPADSRDLHIDEHLTVAPVKTNGTVVDLRQFCSPVENQRSIGSCGPNAAVGGLEMLEIERGDQYVDLSRLFVYYNARAAMQETDVDNGSYIRDVMNSLSTFGVCAEDTWDYDPTMVYIRPPWKCYRTAFAHRTNKFYKIFTTGEDRISEIESALRTHCPVVFGVKVYDSFYHCSGPVAMPSGNLLGGHAMLIVGFDSEKRFFIVRNSWGTAWGDSGYAYMPYEYLEAAQADDFWCPTV